MRQVPLSAWPTGCGTTTGTKPVATPTPPAGTLPRRIQATAATMRPAQDVSCLANGRGEDRLRIDFNLLRLITRRSVSPDLIRSPKGGVRPEFFG
jgi:hypothetical protein